jgi:hypothetical protein
MDDHKLSWDKLDKLEPESDFPSQWNTRKETIYSMYEKYRREHEKLKKYAVFERTLREIQSLPIIYTEYGD